MKIGNFAFSKAFSLIEVVVAMAISSIVLFGASQFLAEVVVNTSRARMANDSFNSITLATKYLDSDFSRSGVNLNTLVVPDINSNNFFSYRPYLTPSDVEMKGDREITLSLDLVKYPGSVRELVFLSEDTSWRYPLVFSPRKGYLTGDDCVEGNSLTFNSICFFEKTLFIEAIDKFGSNVINATINSMYLFQLPQYFRSGKSKEDLVSYSFLASPSAAEETNIKPLNLPRTINPTDSKAEVQSNQYSSFLAAHPQGFALNSLDEFLKKIPFYSGRSTLFYSSKVRLIKYMIEERKVGAFPTVALYRMELLPQYNGEYKRLKVEFLADGFEAIHIRRSSFYDPIINVKFDRQFHMTNDTNKGP